MQTRTSPAPTGRTEAGLAAALCGAVLIAKATEVWVRSGAGHASMPTPDWLALAATVFAATGMTRTEGSPRSDRVQRTLRWGALLLMVWLANGLPFDLLRLTRLIPLPIDWPAVATRTLALAAAIVLAHLAFARSASSTPTRSPCWYGYAAFVLALPYPILRTVWALGGTVGFERPDAGGHGWLPWLACIPWLMAAALSLLLVLMPRWIPRRLLVASGWFAAAFVALVGPGACWVFVTKLIAGAPDLRELGLAAWVPCLFYGSWLLWAVAAAAATHSYQMRTASLASASSA